jgi:hypothetical protein
MLAARALYPSFNSCVGGGLGLISSRYSFASKPGISNRLKKLITNLAP